MNNTKITDYSPETQAYIREEARRAGVPVEKVLENVDRIFSGQDAIYRDPIFFRDAAIYRGNLVWATAKTIQSEIAEVPNNWLQRFAVARPDDVRKLGDSSNSTLLFRISAVLEAIESGELKRRAA